MKAKQFFGSTDIQAPSRLPVGLGGIPINLSCKTGLCCDHGGKIANRDFLPCPQIDGQTSFILFGCEKDPFRGVLYIQKFSGRRSISPQCECGCGLLLWLSHICVLRLE